MRRELALVSVLLLSPIVALADEKPGPGAADNPFAFSPDATRLPESVARFVHEDISSPFTQAHPAEQSKYTMLYLGKYSLPGDSRVPKDEPVKEVQLPPSADRDGHPLWFDGYQGRVTLTNFLRGAIASKRFDVAGRLFEDWSAPSEMFADGLPKLMTFLYVPETDIDDWDATLDVLTEWRRQFPSSRAAAVTEAAFWYNYAWNARGTGYADSVSAEGWKLYTERLEHAGRVLSETKSFAGTSALWAYHYRRIHQELDPRKDHALNIFLNEIRAHDDSWLLYDAMAFSSLPKWGGSWELVESIAREAIARTREKFGLSYYTRIYWTLGPFDQDPNVFRYTKASWPGIKQGFEDMMRLYPHSAHNLNQYAAIACMADDKDTYETVRFKLGKQLKPEMWPTGYSADLCDHKYPAQKM